MNETQAPSEAEKEGLIRFEQQIKRLGEWAARRNQIVDLLDDLIVEDDE